MLVFNVAAALSVSFITVTKIVVRNLVYCLHIDKGRRPRRFQCKAILEPPPLNADALPRALFSPLQHLNSAGFPIKVVATCECKKGLKQCYPTQGETNNGG
jgi:hypothetical protein